MCLGFCIYASIHFCRWRSGIRVVYHQIEMLKPCPWIYLAHCFNATAMSLRHMSKGQNMQHQEARCRTYYSLTMTVAGGKSRRSLAGMFVFKASKAGEACALQWFQICYDLLCCEEIDQWDARIFYFKFEIDSSLGTLRTVKKLDPTVYRKRRS